MKLLVKLLPYLGVVWFLLIIGVDTELERVQQNFLAIFVLVFWGWIFSAVPLYALGLFGVGLSVVFGIASVKDAFAPFASNTILLFMGGFLIARAMAATNLDKRISFYLLSRNFIGGSFRKMLFMMLFLTSFFSMWMSNTATAAMMLPIILGVMKSVKIEDKKVSSVVLLGIAYAASIGGIGTPIGSPPNVIAIGFLKELAGIQVEFLDWMIISIPLLLLLFSLLFLYIVYILPGDLRSFDQGIIKKMRKELPPLSTREVVLVIIFITTVAFWFLPSLLKLVAPENTDLIKTVSASFPAGNVAIFFASLLFIFPLKFDFLRSTDDEAGGKGNEASKDESPCVLGLDDIKKIDWGTLLLFGAGISLGSIFFKTGTAAWFAKGLESYLTTDALLVVILIVVFVTIYATELVSNTATANILIPIIIAIAIQFNLDTVTLTIGVALAASMAFMLPVATPPNAIVYGTGMVTRESMISLGFLLNMAFGFIISVGLYVFVDFIRALLQ